MIEYSVTLGNDLRDVWAGEIIPLIDMIRNSPYFWPGVVAVCVGFILVTRQNIK